MARCAIERIQLLSTYTQKLPQKWQIYLFEFCYCLWYLLSYIDNWQAKLTMPEHATKSYDEELGMRRIELLHVMSVCIRRENCWVNKLGMWGGRKVRGRLAKSICTLLSMWPCTLKSDEVKWTYVRNCFSLYISSVC